MRERDRARDTLVAEGSERWGEEEEEREGGEETLPGVEKEGEEPKSVSSCHHPELSSASLPQPEKNTSLFLTYSSPLSVSQHQSARRCWAQKRQDEVCESASSAASYAALHIQSEI